MLKGDMKVMVVDDNHLDRMIAERLIRAYDFSKQVNSFESPVDGLSFLEELKNKPDEKPWLIFLDIKMPEMDGFEFLKRFEQLPESVKKECRFVVLSSSVNPADRKMAYKYERVIHYMSKPVSEEKLREISLLIG